MRLKDELIINYGSISKYKEKLDEIASRADAIQSVKLTFCESSGRMVVELEEQYKRVMETLAALRDLAKNIGDAIESGAEAFDETDVKCAKRFNNGE